MAGGSPLQVRSCSLPQACPSASVPPALSGSPGFRLWLEALAGVQGGRAVPAGLSSPSALWLGHLAHLLSPHPDAFCLQKELLTLPVLFQNPTGGLSWSGTPCKPELSQPTPPGRCCLLCLLVCVCGDPTREEQGGEGGRPCLPSCHKAFFTESELC